MTCLQKELFLKSGEVRQDHLRFSGQVRVQADSSFHVDFSDFDDDDDDDYVYQNDVPKANQPEGMSTLKKANKENSRIFLKRQLQFCDNNFEQ